MDYSLKRLLMELEGQDEKARAPFDCLEEMAFPTAFAFAVAQWHIPAQPAVVAYLWAWLESQMMAAIKLVPLGQTDGQRILLALGDRRRSPWQFRAGLGFNFDRIRRRQFSRHVQSRTRRPDDLCHRRRRRRQDTAQGGPGNHQIGSAGDQQHRSRAPRGRGS